jgi:hypothetical protein
MNPSDHEGFLEDQVLQLMRQAELEELQRGEREAAKKMAEDYARKVEESLATSGQTPLPRLEIPTSAKHPTGFLRRYWGYAATAAAAAGITLVLSLSLQPTPVENSRSPRTATRESTQGMKESRSAVLSQATGSLKNSAVGGSAVLSQATGSLKKKETARTP